MMDALTHYILKPLQRVQYSVHARKLPAKVLLVAMLCTALPSTQAVEMQPSEYRNALADAMKLFQQQSAESLQLLTPVAIPESSPFHELALKNVVRLQAENKRFGEVWVKSPLNQTNPVVVQIPHKYFDKHTEEIGWALFKLPQVDMIMFNDEQRYTTENSDLTHIQYSLFTAFADAAIRLKTPVKFIQIHGFSRDKRNTEAGEQADIILSNGTHYPFAFMNKIQICVRDKAKLLARIYGHDVDELGATQNRVGQRLNTQANRTPTTTAHFLHVEVSDSLRAVWKSSQLPPGLALCFLQ